MKRFFLFILITSVLIILFPKVVVAQAQVSNCNQLQAAFSNGGSYTLMADIPNCALDWSLVNMLDFDFNGFSATISRDYCMKLI